MATADARQRFRLAVGLGEVLLLRGRYEEASREFQMAVPLADGNLARARIEGKLGELAFKQGDMRTASDLLEKAIGLLGRSLPRSNVGFLCMLISGHCGPDDTFLLAIAIRRTKAD